MPSKCLHFIPGLVILVVGMVALHTSVKLASEQVMLDQYHDVVSAQYEGLTGQEKSAETHRIQSLNQQIRARENWLYWSVIAISLTAFLLLLLNADKLTRLEAMNKEKQEALKLLEQNLAAIEASFEGICIVDGDGNLSYMNSAMMKLHKIPADKRDNYLGESWLELYTPQGREHLFKDVLLAFDGKSFWKGDSEIIRQNGDLLQTELSMTRLDSGGFIGTTRDVTDQKKADAEKKDIREQLYQAQKMEAIGRLAGGIAHDFNNILAAMNGYAEFLAEDMEDGSQPQKFALNILQAGRQARALVDRILTFSRRQGGEMEYVDLREPLEESLSMLRATLPKSIEVKTEINLLKAPINANATQISQMIMNLCVNAGDAMEQGKGMLSISLSQPNLIKDVPIALLKNKLPNPQEPPPLRIQDGEPEQCLLYLGSVAKNKDYIKLSISDTGTGINRLIMEKIFEPFFTTKDIHKGTGLGLSSVHGTITAHGGALVIDSRLGQGTRFDLFFPMSEEKAVAPDDLDEAHMDHAGGTVLVVEDQPEVQQMTVTMLERLGYEVEAALSGLEALDILRENPGKFDVVVTDQNMPQMTGLELVNEAYLDFEDLPFLLLSGYSEEKLENLMRAHPAIKAILRKPVLQKNLGQKVAQILKESVGDKSAVA